MPTINFLVYIIAIAAAYLFKLSYIGWFGSALLWTVVLFPPLAFILSLPTLLTVNTKLSTPDRIFRGDKELGRVAISTRLPLPLGRMNIQVKIKNCFTGQAAQQSFSYSSMGSCICSFTLPTDSCGLLSCAVESPVFSDILGMFRFKRHAPAPAVCTVLPKPAAPDVRPDIDAALDSKKVLKPKYGGGYSEEHELREYRPGDTVRSIHWKLTSKTDEVIIREPLVSEKTEIYVVLSPEGNVEKSLSVLLWLSDELYRMELAHSIVWRHTGSEARSAHIASHADMLDAAANIVSAGCAKASIPDMASALCVFEVADGEVRKL